jgi:hypothetical protein
MDEKTLHIKSYSYLYFPKLGITGVHRTLSSAQAEHPRNGRSRVFLGVAPL